MITKTTRKAPLKGATRRPVRASASITSSVRNNRTPVKASANLAGLTFEQRKFATQLQNNVRRHSNIMAATNTANIAAKPDFLELLPIFVQKLLILDVYGSVAMKSRQQLIPYFKFIAENTKGETPAGTVMSSPFVNRQGVDANFTGRVVRNEVIADTTFGDMALQYAPVLPGSVTVAVTQNGTTTSYVDDGAGNLVDEGGAEKGVIDYATGIVDMEAAQLAEGEGNGAKATYQYDNETVGPNTDGQYGAAMGKGYLQLDEINLVAEAHQLACYWSIYSAFAAQTEYGGNIGDIAKEAAFSEITAEINSLGFQKLAEAAKFDPQFNWNVGPVVSGSVVPTDYMNTFKLKLDQAAAAIYQRTRLSQPNRLVVGTNVNAYLGMINGFVAADTSDNVGPYKSGTLGQFEVYVDPNYNPDKWVMCCKNNDIRRNSALFGEYMPLVSTDAIGLANASVQQGYASMFAMEVVNKDSVVSGRILGTV